MTSLPASLVHLAADNIEAAQAALLPCSLQRVWLISQLSGAELHLPELRSVRLGDRVSDDGLDALTARSPHIAELDISGCFHILDSQRIAASLQRLSRLDSLNVHSNMPLSSDAVVVPMLASGARLRYIDCAGAW